MAHPDRPPPDYDELNRSLRAVGTAVGAAEAHGILCGALCASEDPAAVWPPLILGREPLEDDAAASALRLLTELYRDTRASLRADGFEFQPLLPDADHPLEEQVEGMGDWCRGYLLGLAGGGVKDARALPGDAGVAGGDITKIVEVELDAAGDPQAQERALAEIVEYLRVGVQLVYEELRGNS